MWLSICLVIGAPMGAFPIHLILRSMADGVGFEPTKGVNPYSLSRGAPSATRPPILALAPRAHTLKQPVREPLNTGQSRSYQPDWLDRFSVFGSAARSYSSSAKERSAFRPTAATFFGFMGSAIEVEIVPPVIRPKSATEIPKTQCGWPAAA